MILLILPGLTADQLERSRFTAGRLVNDLYGYF